MSLKHHHHRGVELSSASKSFVSKKWTFLLCIGFFCAGTLFSDRMWPEPEANVASSREAASDERLLLMSEDCDSSKTSLGEVYKSPDATQTLDKTISALEMELTAARAAQESIVNGSPVSDVFKLPETVTKRKYLMVVGINTAFNSRKRRDSVRATWMPPGEERKKLEEEKGIVMRFVIGHSATPGGILDRAIQAEESKHGDFLRLDHVEGYLELSAKTKSYFTTAFALWDADFYVKVDDDVHVNIATLGAELARYRTKPRVYIGCMKSGPVLAQKGVRYHEPEYWKFGEEGNKNVLHKYVNEDVSLGSWFLGLDVEHADDRRLCCGTTDCEWKAQAGNMCVASFDWRCSGICRSADRMKDVHRRCGEGPNALMAASFRNKITEDTH
uniref:Hexosyltransferase n=1 Tax=Brassica campestris TaxID=3711 RepID=M4DRD8_BRACM